MKPFGIEIEKCPHSKFCIYTKKQNCNVPKIDCIAPMLLNPGCTARCKRDCPRYYRLSKQNGKQIIIYSCGNCKHFSKKLFDRNSSKVKLVKKIKETEIADASLEKVIEFLDKYLGDNR